jgi:NADPH:quinone reductase-like Zn-dependent oxidoreductase
MRAVWYDQNGHARAVLEIGHYAVQLARWAVAGHIVATVSRAGPAIARENPA